MATWRDFGPDDEGLEEESEVPAELLRPWRRTSDRNFTPLDEHQWPVVSETRRYTARCWGGGVSNAFKAQGSLAQAMCSVTHRGEPAWFPARAAARQREWEVWYERHKQEKAEAERARLHEERVRLQEGRELRRRQDEQIERLKAEHERRRLFARTDLGIEIATLRAANLAAFIGMDVDIETLRADIKRRIQEEMGR